jgi:hypothetical protein
MRFNINKGSLSLSSSHITTDSSKINFHSYLSFSFSHFPIFTNICSLVHLTYPLGSSSSLLHHIQTGSEAHITYHAVGLVWSSRSVKVIIHLSLILNLTTLGALHPLPHKSSRLIASTPGHFYLSNTNKGMKNIKIFNTDPNSRRVVQRTKISKHIISGLEETSP